jgi:hypothetical protein
VRRAPLARGVHHARALVAEQRALQPGAGGRGGRHAQVHGHAGRVHREPVRVGRLLRHRAQQAGHHEPPPRGRAVVGREPRDEVDHLGARVRVRHLRGDREVRVAAHALQAAARQLRVGLRGRAHERVALAHRRGVLPRHRRQRAVEPGSPGGGARRRARGAGGRGDREEQGERGGGAGDRGHAQRLRGAGQGATRHPGNR